MGRLKILKVKHLTTNFALKLLIPLLMKYIFCQVIHQLWDLFLNPHLSLESNVSGLINILEIIKKRKLDIKLFNAVLVNFLEITKKFL